MSAYKAIWTNTAIKTAGDIVKYLREEWTDREVDNFLGKVDEIISTIEINPKLFRASIKRNNVHLVVIKRRTLLVYQVRPAKKANHPVNVLEYKKESQEIEILIFSA
jgi:hypothetical protein